MRDWLSRLQSTQVNLKGLVSELLQDWQADPDAGELVARHLEAAVTELDQAIATLKRQGLDLETE
jgi:biotin operon repressor